MPSFACSALTFAVREPIFHLLSTRSTAKADSLLSFSGVDKCAFAVNALVPETPGHSSLSAAYPSATTI